MRRLYDLRFAMAGLCAGLLLLVLSWINPFVLLFGVGPAIFSSIVLTCFSIGIRLAVWRAVLAVALSIPAYLIAFFVFAASTSFMQAHGVGASSLISDLGPDTIVGLLVAVVVAAVLLELLALLLSRHWDTRVMAELTAACIGCVFLAFVAGFMYLHFLGHAEGIAQSFLFFGPLFLVGGAATATIIGGQIKSSTRQSGPI